jgi:hypothetical protein
MQAQHGDDWGAGNQTDLDLDNCIIDMGTDEGEGKETDIAKLLQLDDDINLSDEVQHRLTDAFGISLFQTTFDSNGTISATVPSAETKTSDSLAVKQQYWRFRMKLIPTTAAAEWMQKRRGGYLSMSPAIERRDPIRQKSNADFPLKTRDDIPTREKAKVVLL